MYFVNPAAPIYRSACCPVVLEDGLYEMEEWESLASRENMVTGFNLGMHLVHSRGTCIRLPDGSSHVVSFTLPFVEEV